VRNVVKSLIFLVLATSACAPRKDNSDTSSLVTKGARWGNPGAIPVCVMNRGEVNDELYNDVRNFVSTEYQNKTNIRFTGWQQCAGADMNALKIRLYFRRVHNWDGNGNTSGGGLSWIGPVAGSCGNDCGGGTMFVNVGTRGAYPTGNLRQFAMNATRATAVHEFGHAVGLAHEHDRADAPQCGSVKGNIRDGSSYTFVGSYDANSIMNYCKNANIFTLSAGDVAGLAFLYPKAVPNGGGANNGGGNNNGGGTPAPPNASQFTFVTKHSNLCMDVVNYSKDNFAKILQFTCHSGLNQAFRLLDAGGGAFYIQNVNSGKCLDVVNSSLASGAAVGQYNCHNTLNQRVFLQPTTNGSSRLRFAHSNKCLDVSGGTTNLGAVMHQWDCHEGDNQKFFMNKR